MFRSSSAAGSISDVTGTNSSFQPQTETSMSFSRLVHYHDLEVNSKTVEASVAAEDGECQELQMTKQK